MRTDSSSLRHHLVSKESPCDHTAAYGCSGDVQSLNQSTLFSPVNPHFNLVYFKFVELKASFYNAANCKLGLPGPI